MTNKKTINILLVIALSILSFNTVAQVKSDTITAIESYEPFLNDAYKVKDNPSIKDTGKINPNLTYQFLERQVQVSFDLNPIKAAKIKGEPLVKLYRGYAKVGFGTNTTPLIDIYYNAKRSKKWGWGINGKHFSSSGISNVDYSGFSDNRLGVFGKRFLKEFTIDGKLDFNRNINHYFGTPADAGFIIANEDAIKQRLTTYSGKLGLTRNYTDTSQFDYNVNLDFYHLNDFYDVSENNFNMNGNLSKYHKREKYEISMEFNYDKLINPLSLSNNMFVGLQPHISTIADKWEFQVGLGLYLNSFENTKFHFYPQAEFKYNIADDIIIPYVGITGGLVGNSLGKFYSENPFINTSNIAIANTNKKYDIYLGVRGSLTSDLSFNTSFSKQKIESMPLYVKDMTSHFKNQFIVLYDTVDVIKLNGELAYQKLEKWKFILNGDYYVYTSQTQLETWHKPELKISLSGIYDLGNKILVRADLFYIGKQFAQQFVTTSDNNTFIVTEQAQELDGVFDANISLEYRYTKRLSAFINFNNIGSVKYQKWQDYPTQRFGVLGGLTYAF
jgi:hypothetical protein